MKKPSKLTQIKPTIVAPINQAYGELKEDLHFTGYAYERGCHRLRKLLSDGNWKQCGGGFTDVDVFLESLQLDQFAKITEEKREIAKLIKELRPEVSTRAVARSLKTAESTLRGKRAPEGKKANKNNNGVREDRALTGAEAAKVVTRAERVKDQQSNVNERVAKIAFDAKKLGKFSVILADPPWDDEFGTSDRSIENHYPTMSIEKILALPVSEIAHEQAMLFMWATPSMLELALNAVNTWGFNYRTQMVWVKPSIGLGKYARQRHELLLIGRRGDHPAPAPENLFDSVIEAPRGVHSAKPERVYEIIERMYPSATRIEMFLRGAPRAGWSGWGAEADEKAA